MQQYDISPGDEIHFWWSRCSWPELAETVWSMKVPAEGLIAGLRRYFPEYTAAEIASVMAKAHKNGTGPPFCQRCAGIVQKQINWHRDVDAESVAARARVGGDGNTPSKRRCLSHATTVSSGPPPFEHVHYAQNYGHQQQ